MSTKLPFNHFADGVNTIAEDEFVHGTGTYREAGNDNQVTTANGRINHVRRTIEPSAEFEVYGNRTDLASATGLGRAVALKAGGSAGTLVSHADFVGVITAEFDRSRDTTRIRIEGDPLV